MPKFFVEPGKVSENKIIIDTDDVNHIRRVLRLKEDDVIEVSDTTGMDYMAVIEEMTEKSVICKITESRKSDTESNLRVTLFQGIPKGSKMDYIIEKTTELGIFRIVPVMMSRCVVKLENAKAEQKKQERWQKIAVAAAKQSGRGIIPQIEMPVTLPEALEMMKQSDLALVPYECEASNRLKPELQANTDAVNISILIGPEGGIDPAEVSKIHEADIKTVTLGKRILRTETAGEAVLAMIMYELGDI